MREELSVVGKRLPRPDAPDKATGAARYTADIRLPGMLIGKVLRSPYPHARIIRVDTSKARTLPGVEAIITIEDVPRNPFTASGTDVLLRFPLKAELYDEYIFNNKARFIGDAIAAVAAINESIAEEALGLIEVEYEKLPAVFDPIEAMKPDAPRIHDFAERNIALHVPYPFPAGDVEKGFQEADYVVEETFLTTKQKQCQLEPTACIASFDASGRLTVWSPSQVVHPARRKIALIFDMPEGMIRLLSPHVGGAFGARCGLTNELICIALAQKAGKPVRLEDTMEEDFIVRESRQPFIQTGKMGVKRDGTIIAMQTRSFGNAGAYFTHSGGTSGLHMRGFLGLYRCPNMTGEADIVYTNIPVSGAMRGYGNAATMFALEQLIDMAAEKIGIDPVEFRLRNIRKAGEPSQVPTIPIETSTLDECIRLGAEKIGWKEKRARKGEGVRRRGVGMASTMHPTGAYPGLVSHSSAFIKLNEDGSANLAISPGEMGQGSLGIFAQIAAEELGLHAEDIHIVTGDTDVTPFDPGSFATRTTYTIGNAVVGAAREAKSQILERAAKMLEVSAKELDIKDRRIYLKAAPEKGLSAAEVVKGAIYNFKREGLQIIGKYTFEPTNNPPSFQAGFTEVEVDTETGEVKVLKIVVVHDIGRAINPMNVEGQLEGGIVQSIGYALTEDYVINKDTGVVESDNFTTYKIPSLLDLPEIEVILVEHPVPSGPFGAKGVGEPAFEAIAPAIANAIYHAVGVRIKELPITPEKILKALEAK